IFWGGDPMNRFMAAVVVLLVAGAPLATRAADKPAPSGPSLPAKVETRHKIMVDGRQLDYRAIAETFALTDGKGATAASIYTVAYLAEMPAGTPRPIAFVFNGGPGAASVYLHLGAIGPRILQTPGDGALPDPPYRLIDNPSSWLAFTDLVFIDPVGTGFSRAVADKGGNGAEGGDPNKPFWNVRGDLRSLASVVRLWLTRHDRWPSPVYLVGESYGGFRAAALSQTLETQIGVTVNGVVMISPALDYQLLRGGITNLLANAFELPSYAATAASLSGKPESLDELAKVEHFALGGYLTGIAGITGIPPVGDPFIDRVAKTIGLDDDTVRRQRGRVPSGVFVHMLRRSQNQLLSLYDGTVTRATRGNAWQDNAGDPVLVPATAAFTAAFNAYAPDVLGYRTALSYKVLPHDVSQNWEWEGANSGDGGLGLALSSLERTLLAHPKTKVLIVNGRTDLVTPYLASRWLIDQLSIPAAARADIRLLVLPGGHMMYLRHDSRAALAKAAAALFASGGSAPPH
ncbi:MAG: S10 family peptidase, partial [Stellaceae bacterium]